MEAVQMLEADLARERETVRAIVDLADKEGRPVSPAEREASTKALERIKDAKARLDDERDKAALRAAVDGFGALQAQSLDAAPIRHDSGAVKVKARTAGEAVVGDDGFKAWAAKTKESGKAPRFTTPTVEVPYPSPFGMKATGDPVLESDNTELFGTGGNAGTFTTLLGLETPGFLQPRLTVADLLGVIPITVGNSASYPVVKTRGVISGTPQVEGQDKATGEYDFDVETRVLETLAGVIKVSTQFLEDAPGLVAYINADLPYQVRFNEEIAILTALYSAADTADPHTGGATGFDAILDAVTTIQMDNGDPNGMIIHPSDWAILRSEKFAGGTADYVGGGPFTATQNPWDLRVIVTPNATFGAPLVGDFARGAKIYRRGGMSVTSTNSNEDDFNLNLISIRAELRSVIGVTYPELFVEATVSS